MTDRRRRIATLCLLVLLAGCSPQPPDETPTLAAATVSGRIAWCSDQDGDFEIWVMNTDGSDPRQLTDNDARDILPAWSPDGRQIAFVSDRDGNDEIYVMNADGSGLRRLTDSPADESFPAWSPDGGQISFDSNRDGGWDIYVMASDGSGVRRLTTDPADDWISSWSPDGSMIAFESGRDGNYEIYLMDADGANQRRLTDDPAHDGFPAWSPDGTRIAFMSQRDGNYEIYLVNIDGSGLLRLTDDPASDSDPAWSPDGGWLTFVSAREGNDRIHVMRADGSDVRSLNGERGQNWSPSWAPVADAGPVTWTRIFTGPDYGAFLGLTQTPDGAILAVGATEHLHFPPYQGEALLMKVSLEGETLWERTWGGEGYEQACDVTPAAGGGYFVFGETDSIGAGGRDFFLLRIDDAGAEEWVRTYGGPGREWPYGMLPLNNGDLLLYGFSEDDAGVRRPYAVRVGPDGTMIWEYLPGGQVEELVLDAIEVDGDLVLAVNIEEDGKLVKLDGDGSLLWEVRYELPGWQYASRLAPAADGGFFLAGFALVNGRADTWLAAAGRDGQLLWETTFGDPASDDYTHSMIPLRDGTYLLGMIADGMQIVRIAGDGSILWQRSLVGPETYGAMALAELEDGFAIAGLIQIIGGRSYDALLLRTGADGWAGE